MDKFLVFMCLVCFGYPHVSSESVTFDSVTLTAIDPDLLGVGKNEVSDPKNCGSYLFKAKDASDTTALSLNVLVRDFKSPSSLYFRIHPTLMKCIQAAMTKLRNDGTQVVVTKGFQTATDVGASPDEAALYHRSGCGIELAFKTGVTGNVDDIVTAVLKTCPVPMMQMQRDIGIKVSGSNVHIHMKGANHMTGPTFIGLSGGYDQYAKIGEGLDPQMLPDCSSLSTVASGAYYPSGYSDPASVVGEPDVAIQKSMPVDFSRLVQYLGNNIDFGGTCTPYTGNSNDTRCSIRTMTTRMYNVMKYLQKMARDNISNNKLVIKEAFDDSGPSPATLRSEGRAVKVALLNSNTAANLQTLSRYAICAGVDYVAHQGTTLLLAVKKMKGETANMIQFKSIQLMGVEPPSSKEYYYSLPGSFRQSEIDAKYALFDSSRREDVVLNNNATVGMFMSRDPEYRYFRLDPRIVQCYSDIVYSTNKNMHYEGSDEVEIEVIRGFISNPEQAALMDILDNRYDTHTLGVAMQIRYKNGTSAKYTPQRLAQKAVEQCSPIFNKGGEAVGVGVYTDSVFIDIREYFELWVEKNDLIPKGMTLIQYQDFMDERARLANAFRIVDPDDMSEACTLAHPPKKQSLTYDYEEPEISKRKRRRRRATADTCVPTYATPHCTLTAEHLRNEVTEIWTETKRKWIYRNETEVKYALDNCFGICGTCLEGDIYDLKLKHCNNLLHWLPFEMMNDEKDVTNFYPRDNMAARGHACNGGGHCLEKAPLFSILMPSVKRIYRPDPSRSVEELIYAPEENPTPVLQILDEIYGINAKGIVHFWVQDETDMVSMKKALQTVMLYNKDVTQVHIYVMNPISKEPVGSLVEGYVKEFATTGCPKYTRGAVAEFVVMDPPHSVSKRAASHVHQLKNQLVLEQMNWETLSIRGP